MLITNVLHLILICISVLREEKQYIKIPFNIEQAKNLGKVLEHYKDTYYTQVFMSIFVCYILYPFSVLKFK